MTQATTKTRYAILGFGLHASRRLVPAFAASTESVLTGLWRRNPQTAADDARQLNIHSYTTPEELCADPNIDTIFITSPDVLHLDHARIAFAHGKAVLCEKPLAMNAGQAAEIQSLASAANAGAGAILGVGQNFRFNLSVEYLRAQIAAGAIGTPLLAHTQYCYPGHLSARTWISDPTIACGGPIADVGVHCIDSLRFILDTEVKSISALTAKDDPASKVETLTTMQLHMCSGVFANVTCTTRSPYRTLIEITGTEGVLIAENAFSVEAPVEITLRKSGVIIHTHTVSNAGGYTRMIDAFSRSLQSDTTTQPVFTPTGQDAVINQRILDAAYRSAHSGLRELL